jgi:hypothetical protein
LITGVTQAMHGEIKRRFTKPAIGYL